MVTRIAECLIEPHYPDNATKEADYILRKLEKLGMIPPTRIRYTDQDNGNVLYNEECTWEDE